MSMIEVQDLTFAYEGSFDNIFENVTLRLDTDWRLGLVGRNGRGKTTFLNLLRGLYPYKGRITASVPFDYFPFAIADADASAGDAVQKACPNLEGWRLLREMNRLRLDESLLERPFQTLSGGEQVKLLLAALFSRDGHFLLIDEPTSHLDMEGRALVAEYLRSKQGFLLVSHDRAFLDGCVDHILSLNKTNIELQQGNFSSWFANKQRQDAFERAENERLRKDIRRLDEAAKRASAWSDRTEKEKHVRNSGLRPDRGYIGHKAAKMMQRAKSIEDRRENAAAEKQGLLHNIEIADDLKLSPLVYRTERLVELGGVTVQYGDAPVCENIRLSVRRGARIALTGPNGCGKSSLLKLIGGQDIPHTGEVTRGSGLQISYVPQDASFLRGSLKDYARACGIEESLFKAILRKLDFSRIQFEKDMADFSAGQKKKVLIARSLCERAHLYLWDEPLNFIDVFSRMQIERLLLSCRPTLLFVEHDRAFCETIATETAALS
ncbi:ribosomal protection-like ABC-F family protein [Agathobaculum sp.]|uniref:ribosomal protection-like ABC-F family protein n=1 Tax=Agathobaculum sp. TaxID=2048138 RepID=UPI002A7EDE50|nr:ABC-F type ribosomal protection protein [Agathobaculum sp.]MDY3617517.1 ABC-F type ribosomal protection protein [Agathobaculum sp.]